MTYTPEQAEEYHRMYGQYPPGYVPQQSLESTLQQPWDQSQQAYQQPAQQTWPQQQPVYQQPAQQTWQAPHKIEDRVRFLNKVYVLKQGGWREDRFFGKKASPALAETLNQQPGIGDEPADPGRRKALIGIGIGAGVGITAYLGLSGALSDKTNPQAPPSPISMGPTLWGVYVKPGYIDPDGNVFHSGIGASTTVPGLEVNNVRYEIWSKGKKVESDIFYEKGASLSDKFSVYPNFSDLDAYNEPYTVKVIVEKSGKTTIAEIAAIPAKLVLSYLISVNKDQGKYIASFQIEPSNASTNLVVNYEVFEGLKKIDSGSDSDGGTIKVGTLDKPHILSGTYEKSGYKGSLKLPFIPNEVLDLG